MRIGIDARCLTGAYTGDRTYWEGLINGLLKLDADIELVLFTDREIPGAMFPSTPRMRIAMLPSKWGRFFSMIQLPAAAFRYRCDVMHVQYSVSPLFRIPVVTTIHDISYLIHPECFRMKDRWLLQHSVPSAMRKAAQVITVSESSRADIINSYGINPDKIHVTLLAVPERLVASSQPWDDIRSEYNINASYFMLLGVRQPRKNLSLAVRAYAEYRKLGGDAILLIVGKPGWGEDALSKMINECGVADHVQFTGYVPDAHLSALYTHARALLFPSIYEGFGLPPLEAMSLGCAVITSDIPVMHEICGDAALHLSATDPTPWAEAMHRMTVDQSTAYINLGIKRAKSFSWNQMAAKTLKIYQMAQLTHSRA